MERIYNPQSYAYSIECILTKKGLASSHDADEINRAPIDFLDARLSIYEKQSERHYKAAIKFWDKYERYQGKGLEELGEEFAKQLVSDVRELFNA